MGVRRWQMDTEAGAGGGPALDSLRTRAQDALQAHDWPAFYGLRPALERDTAFWTDVWGPATAIAARNLGHSEALTLLRRVVAEGFRQPEIFGDLLERAFGDDPGWARLQTEMTTGVPPSPLTLLDWPVIAPHAALGLLRLPGREEELRSLIPARETGAWDTARGLLRWVTGRWRHANAHMDVNDAVECLRRVEAGDRFACVEYSLVLSQALNALDIPARRVSLRQNDYHAGLGRSHMVSEAWIDDLGAWVVLDGQNGLYWTAADGTPLGAPALQEMAVSGAPVPGYCTYRNDLTDDDTHVWFSYFAHISTTAGTWSAGPFTPVFQREWLVTSNALVHGPAPLYPNLAEVGVETAVAGGAPALRLSAAHPYRAGFVAGGVPLPDDTYVLEMTKGAHEIDLAVVTSYGALAAQRLSYQVR